MNTININQIKKGMFITVYRWTHALDYSYCGEIFEVTDVQIPYLVVARSKQDPMARISDKKLVFDLRRVELMELSDEYVAAALTPGFIEDGKVLKVTDTVVVHEVQYVPVVIERPYFV